jgi:hypothetical protein
MDGNDFGFAHRIGLAANADATPLRKVYARSVTLSPPSPSELQCHQKHFQARHALGLDPWVEIGRVNKTRQIKDPEPRFDSIETETALGMIQQVKVRQQVHGEIAAKRSVAVAAVTADCSNLDRALIEQDIVALMSLGC